MEGDWRPNSDCANASNPFHACAEYCEKRAPGPNPRSRLPLLVCGAQIGEQHEENRGLVASHRNVDPSCRNASNPYHHCADYCWTRTHRAKEQREENRSGTSHMIQSTNTDLVITERMEDKKAEKVGTKLINPNCANASNPYHECADYCFKK